MTANLAMAEKQQHQTTEIPSLCAEIIAVGTELLMGEVVNSNASFLSGELGRIGVNVFYHTAVGDNPKRIQGIFKEALSRSNILLVTGGLGPTDDDLTVSTLAALLDTPMVRDKVSESQIRKFFITRDMPMSPTNLKQADRPIDAEPLYNHMGTAPGLFWDVTEKVEQKGWGTGPKYILAFPGVPREMKAMWEAVALPKLKPLLPNQSVLITRFLKFFGIGESLLGEKLQDLMAQASPTVSPYVGQADVKIRIAAKAPTPQEAIDLIEPIEAEILARVGKYCYTKDDSLLEDVVGQLLKEKQLTLSVAESCTGGLISSRLTDISGSSDYILLNAVTYSNEAKQKLLGVSATTLEQYGAVSEQVASEMALGILKQANTDIGMSITGIAGPTGGSETKPIGLAYIGITSRNEKPLVKKVSVNPQYQRPYIKYWFSQYALNYLRLYLQDLLHSD